MIATRYLHPSGSSWSVVYVGNVNKSCLICPLSFLQSLIPRTSHLQKIPKKKKQPLNFIICWILATLGSLFVFKVKGFGTILDHIQTTNIVAFDQLKCGIGHARCLNRGGGIQSLATQICSFGGGAVAHPVWHCQGVGRPCQGCLTLICYSMKLGGTVFLLVENPKWHKYVYYNG